MKNYLLFISLIYSFYTQGQEHIYLKVDQVEPPENMNLDRYTFEIFDSLGLQDITVKLLPIDTVRQKLLFKIPIDSVLYNRSNELTIVPVFRFINKEAGLGPNTNRLEMDLERISIVDIKINNPTKIFAKLYYIQSSRWKDLNIDPIAPEITDYHKELELYKISNSIPFTHRVQEGVGLYVLYYKAKFYSEKLRINDNYPFQSFEFDLRNE